MSRGSMRVASDPCGGSFSISHAPVCFIHVYAHVVLGVGIYVCNMRARRCVALEHIS